MRWARSTQSEEKEGPKEPERPGETHALHVEQLSHFKHGTFINSETVAQLMQVVVDNPGGVGASKHSMQQLVDDGEVVASPRAVTWADASNEATGPLNIGPRMKEFFVAETTDLTQWRGVVCD